MQDCPQCGRPVDERDAVCPYCGTRMPRPVAPDGSAPPPTPPVPPAPPAAVSAPPAPTGFGRGQLAIVAIAGLLVGAAVVVWLLGRTAGPSHPLARPAPGTSPGPSTGGSTAVTVLKPSAPKWRRTAAPRWASDGSRIVEYEVAAESEIAIWMGRVRPALLVRCFARETDVFVSAKTAASFEAEPGKHTVRLAVDGGPEVAERWSESDDALSLFAPDGVALARRLAKAQMLRFAFTPHNAAPVVVVFDVRGFDAIVASIAKPCGWKP